MNGHRHAAGLRLDASTDSLSQAPRDCGRRKRNVGHAARGAATLLVLGAGAFAVAADSDNIYLAHTDEELSAIAADWQTLTTEERRDYFTEVRRRMAEAGQKRAQALQLPRVVGERRFGRVIPQPDGSVLRIEGVVRYRDGETTQTAQEDAPPDYGTGFEQRVEQSSVTAPVVRVVSEEVVTDEHSPEPPTDEDGAKDRGSARDSRLESATMRGQLSGSA